MTEDIFFCDNTKKTPAGWKEREAEREKGQLKEYRSMLQDHSEGRHGLFVGKCNNVALG